MTEPEEITEDAKTNGEVEGVDVDEIDDSVGKVLDFLKVHEGKAFKRGQLVELVDGVDRHDVKLYRPDLFSLEFHRISRKRLNGESYYYASFSEEKIFFVGAMAITLLFLVVYCVGALMGFWGWA